MNRSGSPARPSSRTPRTSRLLDPGASTPHRRPDPERRTRPIDPAVHVADGIVHHGDDPIAPRTAGMYGIAIDVGTTTVALELVDLDDGRILEVVALENPQRFGGSDVMNRISYDDGPLRGRAAAVTPQGAQQGTARALRAPRHRSARGLTRSWWSATRPCATCSSGSTSRRSGNDPTSRPPSSRSWPESARRPT